jgi:hypothetical protein
MRAAILAQVYALMKNPPAPEVWARFCARLDVPGWRECWEWQGATNHEYGTVFVAKGRQIKSHRRICQWVHGESQIIGLVIDHLWCDNPICANPLHLLPCSIEKNVKRSPKYLGNKTHCVRGHSLTGDNLCGWKLVKGVRECRECRNARRRKPIGYHQ